MAWWLLKIFYNYAARHYNWIIRTAASLTNDFDIMVIENLKYYAARHYGWKIRTAALSKNGYDMTVIENSKNCDARHYLW